MKNLFQAALGITVLWYIDSLKFNVEQSRLALLYEYTLIPLENSCIIATMNTKAQYKVKNWSKYNQSLIGRGDLTLWIDKGIESSWNQDTLTGKRGASRIYSDHAIECMLLLKSVFKLPLRAVQGFAESIIKLMNMDVKIPHYSTVSRRQMCLSLTISCDNKQSLSSTNVT